LYSRYIKAGLICKWADDSQRLILENFDTIKDFPSKVYHEAVPFSPSSSWLHEWYSPQLLQGVRVAKGLQAGWGTCFRTVLFKTVPRAVTCYIGLIAAGFGSGNIIILDAITGGHMSTLSKHIDWVRSLAFSLDGTSLVSGSDDTTVRLWDIQTGGVIRTFHGHTEWVFSVSLSPDQITIASGSDDETIRLWNTQTGECCCIIRYDDKVHSVSFSPTNPQLLISGSEDNTVQQWNTNSNKIGPAFKGSHAAFSPDGTHFVSWGGGDAIVYSSGSGVIITKLQAPGNHFDYFCFSLNGEFVAGAVDNNIYIWDITSSNPHPIRTLVGHTSGINSIAFSSTLISSSDDGTIRFWQIDVSSTNPVLTNLESKPLTSTSIMTISVQAEDHTAISSDEGGLVRVWDISTGLCKASIKTSAGPQSHRDIQLIDGRVFIAWCTRKKIHIWDTGKEKHPKKVNAVSDFSTTSLRISGDGSTVFLLDSEHIQALSTHTGDVVGKVRFEGKLIDSSLTVDGLRVWVDSSYSPTQGWDFGIPGSTLIESSDAPLASPRLDLVHGTTRGHVSVKDTVTGEEILQLPEGYKGFTKMQCDGQYLVASYESGELLILDFSRMVLQ